VLTLDLVPTLAFDGVAKKPFERLASRRANRERIYGWSNNWISLDLIEAERRLH
jgi:hypothetical protein